MKKVFSLFLLSASIITLSCNNENNGKESNDGEEKKSSKSDKQIEKLADATCECMEEVSFSKKTKDLFIKASKSDDPETSLRESLEGIEDPEEKQKVATEMGAANNPELQTCLQNLQKKYPEMENASEKKQNALLEELEEKCEIAAAFFRFGTKGKKEQSSSDDDQ